MSTSISQVSFDETEGTLDVLLRDDLPDPASHIEAEVIEFQDRGVMVDSSSTRYFVPYENILAIKQSV
jgi:hypothetical protein